MRYVITGTACTGKSTLIQALERNNHKVVNEVARDVIKHCQYFKPELLLPENKYEFQAMIDNRQINNYFNYPSAFFDRSIVDELAYRKLYSLDIPDVIHTLVKNLRYDKVFLLESWSEIYKQDEIRKELFEEALEIEILIKEAYKNVGYDLIIVPKIPVEERIKFIEHRINL